MLKCVLCAFNCTTLDAVRLHLQLYYRVHCPCFFSASFLSTALPLPYSTYEHTHWRSLKYRSNLFRSLSHLHRKPLLCSVNSTDEGPSMLLNQWNLTWFWRTDFSIMHTDCVLFPLNVYLCTLVLIKQIMIRAQAASYIRSVEINLWISCTLTHWTKNFKLNGMNWIMIFRKIWKKQQQNKEDEIEFVRALQFITSQRKKMNVAFVLLPRSFNCAVLFVCVFPRFSSSHPVELFVLCCLGLLSWCIWTQLIPFELHILCHHEKNYVTCKGSDPISLGWTNNKNNNYLIDDSMYRAGERQTERESNWREQDHKTFFPSLF